VHIAGKKADYLWRLYAMHRAQEAGIDDVGIGALFGLFDPVFEVMGLLYHAKQLEQDCGVGPHTISFPRIEPAQGSDLAFNPPYLSSDHDFKKIVSVLRLAVPYTGLILTTRENAEFRKELLEVGVSQISAGSRTYPGAYSDTQHDRTDAQQFCVGDRRSLDEVIRSLIGGEQSYIPSWCTACYRLGRTGEHFMELAKTGFIQKFCLPNGLLTFKEYLEDYASEETKIIGNELIRKELATYDDPDRRKLLTDQITRMEAGERDLYL
jgi:2-iminoacetate synthase